MKNPFDAVAQKSIRVCFLLLVAIILSACGPSIGSKFTDAAVKQAEEDFESMFANTQMVYRGDLNSREPDLVLRGDNSRIIVRSKVTPGNLRKREWGLDNVSTYVGARGLAQTSKGKWFAFKFECDVNYDYTPCTAENFYFSLIHVEEAKTWLWRDSELFTEEIYRNTFGEDPPVRQTLM